MEITGFQRFGRRSFWDTFPRLPYPPRFGQTKKPRRKETILLDRDEGFVVNSDNLFRDHGSSRREGTSSAALSHDAIPAPDRP